MLGGLRLEGHRCKAGAEVVMWNLLGAGRLELGPCCHGRKQPIRLEDTVFGGQYASGKRLSATHQLDKLTKSRSPNLILIVPLQPLDGGLIHHSDRGVQYVSIKYTERLAKAEIVPSVGSVGDSYDNALAESVIGLFKTEVIHRRGPWKSLDAVEYATLDWFNNRRLLEPIGNIPPVNPARFNHLRTGNPIESVFATVRHRTVRTKGALSQKTVKLMVFKLVQAAATTWRRLKGLNQLPLIIEGVRFTTAVAANGIENRAA